MTTPQNRRRLKAVPNIPSYPSSPTTSFNKKSNLSLPIYQVPGSSTCNNFLLGGQYYPGKDKKVNHLRRRTLWYRLFCSSSLRTILSTIGITYIIVWHLLVPTVHVVWEYGKILAGNRNVLSGLHLPSVDEEIKTLSTLMRIRTDLRGKTRLKLLKKIVPDFYHRNDVVHTSRIASEIEPSETPIITQSSTLKAEIMDVAKPNPVDQIMQSNSIKEISKDNTSEKSQDDKNLFKESNGNDSNGMQRSLLSIDSDSNLSQCPETVTSIQTTLLIQCSLDRLWILQETCRRWSDPIVAVVYLESENPLWDDWKLNCPQLTIIPYTGLRNQSTQLDYPINRLRNLGLDVVTTSHILVTDVDFVPSQFLDKTIRKVLEERQHQRLTMDISEKIIDENHDAIVVPAFERIVENCTASDCSRYLLTNDTFIPRVFKKLQECVESENCFVFQSKNNWEGHSSTRSHEWLRGEFYEDNVNLNDGSKSRIIKRLHCFDSLRYEPYVIIRWCPSSSSPTGDRGVKPVAPYYDERFYGYGKNKIQLISHLRFLGYQFSILPEGFLVHNPHPESDVKMIWNDKRGHKLHAKMDALYPQFLKELYQKYKKKTDPRHIVQQCNE
jgi:Glycosyl-transferase for dystroglycan